MQSTDAGEILSLIGAHKYALAFAIAIGALIRLLKSDVDWFFTLPATFRLFGRTFESKRVKPWIVVALGVVMVACEKLGGGASWGQAFTDGFIAIALPIVGHQIGIESIRGGKEIPMPQLPPSGPGASGLLLACTLALTGCGAFGKAKSPELAARETVRGAVTGLAWGAQHAAMACADIVDQLDKAEDPRADHLADTCEQSWLDAKVALIAADHIVDTWDAASAGKLPCLASRALTAIDSTLAAMDSFGAKLPPNVSATIEDGIKLGKFLVSLVPGATCSMPAPAPKPAEPATKALNVSRGDMLRALVTA